MAEPVHEVEYKDCTIKIYQDEDAESPRAWDNLGKMACWHNRYNLGDEQPKRNPLEHKIYLICEHVDPDYESEIAEYEEELYEKRAGLDGKAFWDADKEHGERVRRKIEDKFDEHFVSLPLYLYDHGGITMSTGKFSCPWDSGQVGFIYASHEDVLKECGVPDAKVVTKEIVEWAVGVLTGEVKDYDQFIMGNVYGYVVEDADGEGIDSCWGFYDDGNFHWDDSGIMGEAKSFVDSHNETEVAA